MHRARPELPAVCGQAQVQAIAAAADTATADGIRDLAVVMMFSRLGLGAARSQG